MTQIRDLSSTTAVASGDLIPIASAANGVDMKMSVNQLLTFIESAFASPEFTVQTGTPTTGGTQAIGSVTTNVWLILAPASSLSALTVTLPPASSAVDGQLVLVSTSQAIDTLTVTSSGATVASSPSRLSANSSFTLRYNTSALTWYQVAVATTSYLNLGIANITDKNGNEVIECSAVANAVNHIAVTQAIAGGTPILLCRGDDTDVGLTFTAKGAGVFTFSTLVKQTPVTIASLPAAASHPGARYFVSNHNAALTFGTAPTAGGSTIVPVYSNGVAWLMG